MILHLGPLGGDEASELAVAHALLRRAGDGELEEALRVYAPARPAVVFGRRDTRLPGFGAAIGAAHAAGFDTAVRAVGGRAVAYTEQAVVVDHVRAEPQTAQGMDRRFVDYGRRFVDVFAGLGIDARVGPVPGEYCPGAHSVNARDEVKLVGTAQRVLPRSWLFSSLVNVGDRERVREVLREVYGHLDLPFDPASVGTLSSEVSGVGTDDVVGAVAGAWGVRLTDAVDVGAETLARAGGLAADHRTPG
ncbi:lipoate-protein ligase A [Nocardioides cavernae]|uniref:Lipoate-protein ligase A n=1 Tax=Nocardioides cavernae TaxID=1921566 RepID=A0A7Y9H1F1_9ACTN|nr:lipoate--protein ligase family protein [Nocardioides cavernae]NYE36200.1 lipoate-protein ligase A [Nocardioides cavernae]